MEKSKEIAIIADVLIELGFGPLILEGADPETMFSLLSAKLDQQIVGSYKKEKAQAHTDQSTRLKP